ncbi:HAD family hydrolase [Lysobacter sp. H23M47]|uniref:HAD family hydrolase n=1 Tax=Lysobacter sp. H23M47 TaxID=2781024 RepID=UPI00187DF6F3|nr:HAD family hydrolase [Lysobacter sp. H23M47]QOW25894.1 HAD family hydrolase [Lysobacter sp. H23M47]
MIGMVGFDADDTLWRSQDYFDEAQEAFEQILAPWADLDRPGARDRLYQVESGNIGVFGYGVKGMVLSMLEAAIELSDARISAADLQRILGLGKELLRHPVELLPGIAEAVEAIAREHPVVMITKGDLFHQEAKVRDCGMADLFGRIEIVSEKDPATYRRLLAEFGLQAPQFLMIGNSLRSDILPVLALGGWGIHVPYHSTWVHERAAPVPEGERRFRQVNTAAALPAAVAELAAVAQRAP